MSDLWDNLKPYRDPLSGRMLMRPVGQRVSVKKHAYNGTILGIVQTRKRNPETGRREPPGGRYEVEHDNGEVCLWPWHALEMETPLEALAKMVETGGKL